MLPVLLTTLLNKVIQLMLCLIRRMTKMRRHICAATYAEPSTSSEPFSSCVWMCQLGHVRRPLPTPFWMVAPASCMGFHPSPAHEGCNVGFCPCWWNHETIHRIL